MISWYFGPFLVLFRLQTINQDVLSMKILPTMLEYNSFKFHNWTFWKLLWVSFSTPSAKVVKCFKCNYKKTANFAQISKNPFSVENDLEMCLFRCHKHWGPWWFLFKLSKNWKYFASNKDSLIVLVLFELTNNNHWKLMYNMSVLFDNDWLGSFWVLDRNTIVEDNVDVKWLRISVRDNNFGHKM